MRIITRERAAKAKTRAQITPLWKSHFKRVSKAQDATIAAGMGNATAREIAADTSHRFSATYKALEQERTILDIRTRQLGLTLSDIRIF